MKYIKYIIPIFILFLSIGFAAINVTLSISGDAYIASDLDDFEVYVSGITLDGVEDVSLLREELSFEFTAPAPRTEPYVISVQLTNNSSKFDAMLSVACSITDTLTVIDNQVVPEVIEAKSSDLATFDFDVSSLEDGNTSNLSCVFTATPIERTSLGEGEVDGAIDPWATGRLITIGTEKFNIISSDDTSVTLLAQQNISNVSPYIQASSSNNVNFSASSGWEYTPGPKEIDVQTWGGDVKTVLNGYVDYLNSYLSLDVTGDLITLTELGELGCTVPSDYAYGSSAWTCTGSQYSDWLVNGLDWWTRSASADDSDSIWFMYDDGSFDIGYYVGRFTGYGGVRPVITISKESLNTVLSKTLITFTIGDVTYYTEEGMTWGEWVNSDYSNSEFALGTCDCSGCTFVDEGSAIIPINQSDMVVYNAGTVHSDQKINSFYVYTIEDPTWDMGCSL